MNLSVNLINLEKEKVAADYYPLQKNFMTWVSASILNVYEEVEISIALMSKAEMQRLNYQYRNQNKPTNILSFPYDSPLPDCRYLLGDLVICPEIVQAEIQRDAYLPILHWAHLTVHGVLHLQGYDHEVEEEALIMEGEEQRILKKLGFEVSWV